MKLQFGANRRRPRTSRRDRYARVEALEPRCMLAAPTLGPLPDVTVAAGAPLHMALDGFDLDGDSLTYSVSSSNPVLTGSIPKQDNPNGNRSLRIVVEDYGQMEFELFEGRVPGATSRIIELAQSGWYDSRIFHRILSGFMIQGGSRDGLGYNGSGVTFDDEFHPTLQHTSGRLLSMAKSGDDSNDSQFFITAEATRWLDFNHSIFGMLTDGDDVRQTIEALDVDANGRPTNPAEIPVIASMTIFQDTENGVMMLSAPEGTTADADVTVTVSDGQGGTAQQTIHVSVLPDNLVTSQHNALPYLEPIDSVWTSIDTPLSFNVNAIDIEGDPVFYSAQVESGAAYMDVSVSAAGLVNVTPKGGKFGIFGVKLRAGPSPESVDGQHGESQQDSQTTYVFVRPPTPTLELQPTSDTGRRDGITAINNTGGPQLQFTVSGVDPQATVGLMIDGNVQQTTELGRAPLNDGSGNDAVEVALSTPLADAVYAISARQAFDLAEPFSQIEYTSEPSDSITVTIDTQAPTIVSPPVLEAFVGQEYVYQVSADDGANDVLEYGLGGSKPDAMTIDPDTGAITWTPLPTDPASYQLVVSATDGAGNQGQQEFDLFLTNVAPAAAITGAPAAGAEGAEISLAAQVTDPDSDSFTYSWAVLKDDSPYETGSDSTFAFTPDDGDADYVVSLTVTDDDMGTGEAVPVTILATNVAPTIIVEGGDTIAEGAEYSLTLGTITDLGQDTVTQWTVHWGDGETDTYADGGVKTHTYTDDNPTGTASDPYTITVDLADEDGIHAGAGSKGITVTNVAPTVNVGADDTVNEGSPFTGSGSFTDPGADTWTATVDYGDNSGVQPLTLNVDRTFDLSHTYAGAADYTVVVTVSDDDADIGSDTLLVTVKPGEPIDLGPIDFLLLEHLSLGDGSLYFRLETTHGGFLSLQVDVPKPAKSARMKLYDIDPTETAELTPLAISSLDEDDNQRIDWDVVSDQTYYIEVYGSNVDFDLRIANLLHHDGTAVTVFGTDSNDTFEFDAAASRDVTINGVRYHFDDAQVESVTFDGGHGYDTVELRDSSGDDTLEAWPNEAVFTNGPGDDTLDFVVNVSGFEDLQAYAAAGGTDTAALHGSANKDKLKSYEDFLRLRASNSSYSLRAKDFDEVVGDGGPEGPDIAIFNGAADNDIFRYTGADNTAQIESTGRDHRAVGFSSVIARAGGGNANLAYFTDTPGEEGRTDDVFYFKSHKTKLVSDTVEVTARAFDEVHATASEGGFDVARIYDTPFDDHFEFDGDTARLYRRIGSELELLYEAIAFEKVKTYRTTGDDTRDVRDHTFELIQNGWLD